MPWRHRVIRAGILDPRLAELSVHHPQRPERRFRESRKAEPATKLGSPYVLALHMRMVRVLEHVAWDSEVFPQDEVLAALARAAVSLEGSCNYIVPGCAVCIPSAAAGLSFFSWVLLLGLARLAPRAPRTQPKPRAPRTLLQSLL